QPIAPAELGPMFWPKFVSTLLIAPSTCHGMPYALPAACQTCCSCSEESWTGCAGADSQSAASGSVAFGDEALGSAGGAAGVAAAGAGTAGAVSALAAPAQSSSVSAATARS